MPELGLAQTCRTQDGEIALICSKEIHLKLLRITGLNSVFRLYSSVDSLLAG
jgi:anti-anti-sigma regulatory factor